MDPNVTLAEIRDLLADLADSQVTPTRGVIAEEIAEKFQALDTWLRNGGFPPTDWSR